MRGYGSSQSAIGSDFARVSVVPVFALTAQKVGIRTYLWCSVVALFIREDGVTHPLSPTQLNFSRPFSLCKWARLRCNFRCEAVVVWCGNLHAMQPDVITAHCHVITYVQYLFGHFALLRFKMHWLNLYAPTKSIVGYWLCPIDMPLWQMSKLRIDSTLMHMARIFLLFAQTCGVKEQKSS